MAKKVIGKPAGMLEPFLLCSKNNIWETDFVCKKGNWKIDPGRAAKFLGFNMFWLDNVGAFYSCSKTIFKLLVEFVSLERVSKNGPKKESYIFGTKNLKP